VSEHTKKFREIGQRLMSEVTRVKCDRADYIEGLDDIIADLEAARDAAQEELDDEVDDDGDEDDSDEEDDE